MGRVPGLGLAPAGGIGHQIARHPIAAPVVASEDEDQPGPLDPAASGGRAERGAGDRLDAPEVDDDLDRRCLGPANGGGLGPEKSAGGLAVSVSSLRSGSRLQ